MGRPKAEKTEDFEKVQERLFQVSRCSNGTELAKFMGFDAVSSVTRQLKAQRIPDSWFALIAKKANADENYLRTGILAHSGGPEEKDEENPTEKETASQELSGGHGEISEDRGVQSSGLGYNAAIQKIQQLEREVEVMTKDVIDVLRENSDLKSQIIEQGKELAEREALIVELREQLRKKSQGGQ